MGAPVRGAPTKLTILLNTEEVVMAGGRFHLDLTIRGALLLIQQLDTKLRAVSPGYVATRRGLNVIPIEEGREIG